VTLTVTEPAVDDSTDAWVRADAGISAPVVPVIVTPALPRRGGNGGGE
jgi:hypothetical protein